MLPLGEDGNWHKLLQLVVNYANLVDEALDGTGSIVILKELFSDFFDGLKIKEDGLEAGSVDAEELSIHVL